MKNIYMEMPKLGSITMGVFASGENIPNDPDNEDWKAFQAFLSGGGAPLPFDPAMEWKGTEWVINPAKVAVQLDAVKTNALDRIATFSKSKRALIAGTSDDAEIAGWNNKLRIAQAIVANTATDGEKAAFQAEINARGIKGETLAAFTQKVITNAGFFAQAVGLIDGLKRKAQDSVAAAKTPDEVAAVLDGMKTQAEAAFAQLMQATK